MTLAHPLAPSHAVIYGVVTEEVYNGGKLIGKGPAVAATVRVYARQPGFVLGGQSLPPGAISQTVTNGAGRYELGVNREVDEVWVMAGLNLRNRQGNGRWWIVESGPYPTPIHLDLILPIQLDLV